MPNLTQLTTEVENLINGFIQKWCPDKYAHFIDTDENEANRLRNQIKNRISQAEQIGYERGRSELAEEVKKCMPSHDAVQNLLINETK